MNGHQQQLRFNTVCWVPLGVSTSGLGWSLRTCISNKLPDYADAAGVGSPLDPHSSPLSLWVLQGCCFCLASVSLTVQWEEGVPWKPALYRLPGDADKRAGAQGCPVQEPYGHVAIGDGRAALQKHCEGRKTAESQVGQGCIQ